MALLSNNRYIFIGDVIVYRSISTSMSCLGKVEKFQMVSIATKIHNSMCYDFVIISQRYRKELNREELYVLVHEIVQEPHTGHYLITLHASCAIPLTSVDGLSQLTFTRECCGKVTEEGMATHLNDAVRRIKYTVPLQYQLQSSNRNGRTSYMYTIQRKEEYQ